MKVLRKDKGVSEVLGSILVLLITVTLFSSVFYYINTIPTPKQGTYSEFNANIQFFNESGNTYVNISVENVGGESIRVSTTMFIVAIDLSVDRHMLTEFGNQSFVKDGWFSQGESFFYNSSWYGQTATPQSNIEIMLYDKANMQVIWTAKLHGSYNMPPVLVSVFSNPSPIVLGKYATISAIIFDPDTAQSISDYNVWIDLSSLNESSNVTMTYSSNNLFITNPIQFTDTSLDVKKAYLVVVHIEDKYGNEVSYSEYLYVTRGTSIKGADVFIDPSLVTLSDATPTHMDDVTVTVTVQNRGGTGATFKLEVFDEYSGYNTTGNIIMIDTNLGNPMPENGTYTVSAAGQTTITFVWKEVGTNSTGVSMGKVAGNHHLIIKAIDVQGVDGSPEENRYPDVANVGVTVLPKILFVDADQALEGTPNDVSKYYKYLLDTCDYQYTTKRVLGSATLSYDGTLRNYDVVIWETGYFGDGTDTNSAISSAQMNELRIFYDNGGALWIISPEVSPTYLLNYFGLSANAPAAYTGTVTGDPANSYVDLTLSSGAPISTTLINDRSDASNVANVITINPGKGDPLLDTNTNKVVGVTLTNGNGKLVYFGFEFSRIEHYYRQNFIGYRVLQWLGNITERLGNDVAVDDFLLSTLHPLYMQPVTITAVVSNNGGQPISTEVMLKIDGIKPPDISPNPNTTGIIPGNGGFVYVNFTWVPKSPGLHTIELMADPFNVIKETNEENNYLDSSLLNTNIYVEFSTLIIYNTTEASANTTDPHLTSVIQAFKDLSYAYEELNVSDASALPGDYESGSYFSRYNLVIWVEVNGSIVDSTGTTNYIGPRDAKAIYNAEMLSSTEFMFVGPKMPEILSYAYYSTGTTTNLLEDLFGVRIVSNGEYNESNYVMFGYNAKDSPTNGLDYVIHCAGAGAQDIDWLQATNSPGMGLFRDPRLTTRSLTYLQAVYQKKSTSTYGYGVATVSSLGAKVMIVPFSMSDVLGVFGLHYTFKPTYPAEQARAQLLFHELRWFGQLEMRPELAVYEPEIKIQSELPRIIVGHSYMLQATIHNFGDVSVSAVVRFYDDYEWIGTKSVYVGANNETTVEIVWTPMFASHARHVRIVVDPLNEVKEITAPGLGEVMNFNNEAIKTVTVWYFWDNMEYGSTNWEHEATVLNINGETPLNFLARKDVSTNVVGDWDWSESTAIDNNYNLYVDNGPNKYVYLSNYSGVSQWTHNASHTQPAAYWLPETPGESGRLPIDLMIVLDDSGSMSGTKWDNAVQAAKDAVGMLTSQDRVAIYTFYESYPNVDPELLVPFTYCTEANKDAINNTLDSLTPNTWTPLYDTIAAAGEYLEESMRSGVVAGMIILTDGESNSDGLYYVHAPGTSSASEGYYRDYYADYNDWTDPTYDWNGFESPYTSDVLTTGSHYSSTKYGCLGMPWSVDAVAIGTPSEIDSGFKWIGWTAKGHINWYNRTTDASTLPAIFRNFVENLQTQAGSVKAISGDHKVTPSSEVRATSGGNYFKFINGNFETGDLMGWNFDPNAVPTVTTTQSVSGKYSVEISGDGEWMAEPFRIPSGVTSAKISMYYYPNGGRYGYSSGYILDENWNVLLTLFSTRGSAGSWIYVSADLTPYIGKTLYLYFESDGSSGDFYVDDINVSYTSPGSSIYNYNIKPMRYRILTTPAVQVTDAKKMILSFWTKYWLTEGTNGGFLMLWGSTDGTTWTWNYDNLRYVKPTQPYTGNLMMGTDASGNPIGIDKPQDVAMWNNPDGLPYWCFNGRSGGGTFTWQYVEADLTQYIKGFKAIRVLFVMAQYGGVSANDGWTPERGWYIDDVQIKVISDSSNDLWQLHNFGGHGPLKAHSGKYAWEYTAGATANLPAGVDSSLITKQIDLSSARTATLKFWIRFNLNPASGLPPATVRVEVSDDNGVSWQSITYGVRIGWNASGTDTIYHDGKSYSGISGPANEYGWVPSSTLMRINCDLSGWAGQSILLRFRVVTNATGDPTYDPAYSTDPHGVFIDDVFVYGESYAQAIPATSSYYIWT